MLVKLLHPSSLTPSGRHLSAPSTQFRPPHDLTIEGLTTAVGEPVNYLGLLPYFSYFTFINMEHNDLPDLKATFMPYFLTRSLLTWGVLGPEVQVPVYVGALPVDSDVRDAILSLFLLSDSY